MDQAQRQHIARENYYDNILVLSPNNVPLTCFSEDRVEWYAKKDLIYDVENIPPFTRTVKLKFNDDLEVGKLFDISFKETQCVVCGKKNDLSLHHVIPRCLRTEFPDKSRNSAWCLLMCEKHHTEIERNLENLYKDRFNAKNDEIFSGFNNIVSKEYRDQLSVKITIRSKMDDGGWDNFSDDAKDKIIKASGLSSLDELLSLDELIKEKDSITKKREEYTTQQRKEWVIEFIQSHFGGFDGARQTFRETLLSMNPQYLPPGAMDMES